uniref:Uncharacterized protein n=1 Tax=Cyprinus carpio TaxID=7962 RepID=A0A8C2F4E7_CYPCA
VVRRQLLQRYEHQPFVSCLAGLYGCQWRRYQRLECTSFVLLTVTFFLTLIFLYFWSEAQNDYNDFDWHRKPLKNCILLMQCAFNFLIIIIIFFLCVSLLLVNYIITIHD